MSNVRVLAPVGLFCLMALPALLPLFTAWMALVYGRILMAIRYLMFPALGLGIALVAAEALARALNGVAPVSWAALISG